MKKYEVLTKPSDTITDLCLNQNLLVSSWDGNLYQYNPDNGDLLSVYEHGIPITKMSSGDTTMFADIQGQVSILSHENKILNTLDTAIVGIHRLESYNGMTIASGWSKQLALITDNSLEYIDIDFKSQYSYLNDNNLALVDSDKVNIIDLRNLKVYYTRKVNEQVRSVLLKDNLLFIGTYGGKLRVLDTLTSEENVVNAHKKVEGSKKIGYPLNQISNYNEIYTCGSDGTINTFSFKEKITQKVLFSFDYGVLKFTKYKSTFVVCCGYNFEQGEGDTSNNPIFIYNS